MTNPIPAYTCKPGHTPFARASVKVLFSETGALTHFEDGTGIFYIEAGSSMDASRVISAIEADPLSPHSNIDNEVRVVNAHEWDNGAVSVCVRVDRSYFKSVIDHEMLQAFDVHCACLTTNFFDDFIERFNAMDCGNIVAASSRMTSDKKKAA